MKMREEKTKKTSPSNKKTWLWPMIYASLAVFFVGMVWGYSAYVKNSSSDVADSTMNNEGGQDVVIETAAPTEVLKYPFDEKLLEQVSILQNFYDLEADDNLRDNALLVFNQTYETSSGISISIENEPFEVLAARSGVVEEVITDVFQGDEVVVSHADGLTTVYSSLTSVAVKKGDEIEQGTTLGNATANEWNPNAGTHLHFKVLVDGEAVNPASYLGFN